MEVTSFLQQELLVKMFFLLFDFREHVRYLTDGYRVQLFYVNNNNLMDNNNSNYRLFPQSSQYITNQLNVKVKQIYSGWTPETSIKKLI